MKPIRTKADFNRVAKRIEELCDKKVKKGTDEGDELEILTILAEHWQEENVKIDVPDLPAYLEFKIDQGSLKMKELVEFFGKSTASKIMNRKKHLTMKMAFEFKKRFDVPGDVIVKEYKLK